MRYGNARNQEPFTQSDMWVTRQNSSQIMPRDLPQYVSAQNAIVDQDIVLWYTSSIHHSVRTEDRGATHVMWTGFILMPHDLFDKSPLYP
jgi:primary-amine oxidase